MKVANKAYLFSLILLLPVVAFGASDTLGAFSVDPADKSLEFLSMIFGAVPGSIPAGSTNNIFGKMVYVFNQAVFGLGIIIVSYTAVMGAVNTAHEGEFLGKNWHSVLVPLRAGVGILLLIPQGSGYNYMQMIVMWFIVQGVGAANAMWTNVVRNNVPIHEDTRKDDVKGAQSLVTEILKADACMHALNSTTDTNVADKLGGPVSIFTTADRVNWGRAGSGDATPLCGFIDLKIINSAFSGQKDQGLLTARIAGYKAAISQVASDLMIFAQQAILNPNDPTTYPAAASQFISAARTIENVAKSTSNLTYEAGLKFTDETIQNGWILAGSYYYQLTQSGTRKTVTISFTGNEISPSDQLSPLIGSTAYNSIVVPARTNASTFVANAINSIVTVPTWDRAGPSLILSPRPSGGSTGTSIFAAIFGSLFEQITNNLTVEMSGAGPGGAANKNDPLVSLTSFGSNLVVITENTFFAALGLAFGVWIVSALMSCMQPLAHTMNFLLTIIMPIAMLMISLLWVAGLTLGLYIPMIPYLVFTFSALSWIIMVIEAMLAAPLIALSLIVPAEDEMGKAGHAIVILLGIFLRPALMILGFILAMQLLIVAIGMLNVAFWSTMLSSTGGSLRIGVFGLIAILLLYASIACGMVHEAFSLIYLVPNKVMRWISGTGGDDDAMKHVKELKGSVQKGAGIGSGLMKSSLGALKK